MKWEMYNHLRKLVLYNKQVIKKFKKDPVMNLLASPVDSSRLVIKNISTILIETPKRDTLQIDTGIFRTSLLQHTAKFKKDYYSAENRFILGSVLRERAERVLFGNEYYYSDEEEEEFGLENEFKGDHPHTFTFLEENQSCEGFFAKQKRPRGQVVIFKGSEEDCGRGNKYDEDYCAVLEDGFWGRHWDLWDCGLTGSEKGQVPEGFGTKRKKLMGNFVYLSKQGNEWSEGRG
jgi:hypothetical protein